MFILKDMNLSIFQLSVFKTAFRIFFLASAFHFVSILTIWLFQLNGYTTGLQARYPVQWHGYEMVFGFSRAVIIGFIFTAGQNWTGKILLREKSLFLVFCLWFLGRLAWFVPPIVSEILLGADLIAGAIIFTKLILAFSHEGQAHNRKLAWLWLVFTCTQLAIILGMKDIFLTEYLSGILRNSVLQVLAYIVIIAGRILPFFAHKALPEIIPIQKKFIEQSVIPATYLLLVIDIVAIFFPQTSMPRYIYFTLFGLLNLVRWYYWGALKTWKKPILAVLFWGYFFMCLGFLMSMPPIAFYKLHLMNLGAIALFVMGMLTRVSLGHTGRVIHAGWLANLAYIFLVAGMIIRVLFPLLGVPNQGYLISGILVILGFTFFLIKYTSILTFPRADGRPE